MVRMLVIVPSAWAFSYCHRGSVLCGNAHDATDEEFPLFLLQHQATLELGGSKSCPHIAPAQGKVCTVLAVFEKDVSTEDIKTITANKCPGAQTNVMPALKIS